MIAHGALVSLVVEALQRTPPVAGGNIQRGRRRPVPEGTTEYVVVRKATSRPDVPAVADAPVDWLTTVIVECYGRSNELPADEASDLVLTAAYSRLYGSPELTDAAMEMLPPRLLWDEDDQDQHAGCSVMEIDFRHRTSANTLE